MSFPGTFCSQFTFLRILNPPERSTGWAHMHSVHAGAVQTHFFISALFSENTFQKTSFWFRFGVRLWVVFWCLSGGLWGRFRGYFWRPFRLKTVQKQIQEATPEEVGPGEAILAETVQKRCPHHSKLKVLWLLYCFLKGRVSAET